MTLWSQSPEMKIKKEENYLQMELLEPKEKYLPTQHYFTVPSVVIWINPLTKSKRHFWKKNPNKIPKIPFWEICKRPFWKKNPDFFPGYMVMNFQKIFFREMS